MDGGTSLVVEVRKSIPVLQYALATRDPNGNRSAGGKKDINIVTLLSSHRLAQHMRAYRGLL